MEACHASGDSTWLAMLHFFTNHKKARCLAQSNRGAIPCAHYQYLPNLRHTTKHTPACSQSGYEKDQRCVKCGSLEKIQDMKTLISTMIDACWFFAQWRAASAAVRTFCDIHKWRLTLHHIVGYRNSLRQDRLPAGLMLLKMFCT